MEHHSEQLNDLFQALADPTRRAVLGRLGRGPASISELARPFDMALPSFMKHIHCLEESGWIQTRKQGRVRTCIIEKAAFAAADAWLAEQRALWAARFDRLDALLEADKDDYFLDLEIVRVLAAPRAKVWRAWSDPDILKQWWCPKPWVTDVRAFDFRSGGAFHTFMSGPDGGESDNPGLFLEVAPMERIVWTSMLIKGWRPAEPWIGMTGIFILEDDGAGTRYTARCLHKNDADRKQHEEMGFFDGWGIMIQQMEEVARSLP